MATAKIKKETEIIVPPNTPVKVLERRDKDGNVIGSSATYEAEVEQNEVENETDPETENEFGDLGNEDYGAEFESENQIIPDTPLEILFKQLRGAIGQGVPDNFLAMVSRAPDPIGMRFNYPNSVPFMSLGAFSFSSRDLFNFDSAIQEKNRNSGGIFNIKIYKSDNTPLMLRRNRYDFQQRGQPEYYEIGLTNYPVPDPVKIENGVMPGQSGNIENMMLEYMKTSDNRFADLLQQMNKPREKTTLENAIEQKVLNDILNPPQHNNSNDAFQQTMLTMLTLPQMVDGFSKKMFPQETPPPEPNAIDHITKLLENPVVANFADGLVNVSEKFAISKMKGQAETVEQASEFDEPDEPQAAAPENTEMKELITSLIVELESDRAINADNEFMAHLQTNYPTQAQIVVTMCKSVDNFDMVVKMLGGAMNQIEPNPIIPFVDLNATQAKGEYVWNERGGKLRDRLNEFYVFVRTLN